MEIAPRITVDEKVRFGKPVVKGIRVPVDLILGKLAGGMACEIEMVRHARRNWVCLPIHDNKVNSGHPRNDLPAACPLRDKLETRSPFC